MEYPGGKGNLYQQIINLIPPHRVYIETHLGGGAIFRHKKPARHNIGIDLDRAALAQIRSYLARDGDTAAGDELFLVHGDATEWLKAYPFQGDEFIYADPPYLMETRRQHRHMNIPNSSTSSCWTS